MPNHNSRRLHGIDGKIASLVVLLAIFLFCCGHLACVEFPLEHRDPSGACSRMEERLVAV